VTVNASKYPLLPFPFKSLIYMRGRRPHLKIDPPHRTARSHGHTRIVMHRFGKLILSDITVGAGARDVVFLGQHNEEIASLRSQ
jgi:hypothetical protein